MSKKNKVLLAILVCAFAVILLVYKVINKNVDSENAPLRLAIFVGGRTVSVYRAILSDRYKALQLDMEYITKDLYGSDKSEGLGHDEYKTFRNDEAKAMLESKGAAKARGNDLIDLVLNGQADAATIGESSFIKYAAQGAPIIAVACIGYDSKKYPGHAIVLRKDIKIRNSKELKGRKFIVRRSSGGDLLFFREFLLAEGLDPDRDVTIVDTDSPDDQFRKKFIRKEVDGAYAHLRPTIQSLNLYYVYRPLNWLNAELSQAVLVFRKDYVEKHPEKVEKLIEGTMQQNLHELSLPKSKRCINIKKVEPRKISKEVIQVNLNGLNMPIMDRVPLVSLPLLNEMQDLLMKHKMIDKKAELKNFIDNSFVEKLKDKMNLSNVAAGTGECE